MNNRLSFLARLPGGPQAYLSLGFGLLAAAVSFVWLKNKAARLEAAAKPVTVLTAARFLPAGTILRSSDVQAKVIPELYVEPSAVNDLKVVEGLAALVPLSPGSQIQTNLFGRPQEGVAAFLEPGKRAYTLRMPADKNIAGLLQPGHRVDILAKWEQGNREVTRFLFQNVPVIAVGRRTLVFGNDEKESASDYGGEDLVTLVLEPRQIETLFYLEGKADLKLALRAVGDEEPVLLPARNVQQVLEEAAQIQPLGRTLRVIEP